MDRWVSAEARRTRRPKGTVLESLAQEALKARQYPGIAFRGDDWDRRAWVMGTSLDVWEIVRGYQDLGSIEKVAAGRSLTAMHVRVALAYYERFADEIDAHVERDRRTPDDLRAAYPSMEFVET